MPVILSRIHHDEQFHLRGFGRLRGPASKRRSSTHGGESCTGIQTLAPRPRRIRSNIALNEFWGLLEPKRRENALGTL
jgi:hypothetical protein